MIKIHFANSANSDHFAKALYAFEELLWRCGEAVRPESNPQEADVIYGGAAQSISVGTAWIRADLPLFDAANQSVRFDCTDLESTRQGVSDGTLDPLGWTYRFLTLADETAVASDRADGNKPRTSLPAWRQRLAHLPVVEYLSASLSAALRAQGVACPEYRGLDRSVLLMTHDTDATNLSHPLEIMYNMVKGVVRASAKDWRLGMDGLRARGTRYADNPLFGFERWCREFGEHKHAFYLSFRGVTRSALNDVRSSASDAQFPWPLLRELSQCGRIEFGVHPSINTRKNQKHYTAVKRLCEEKLQAPITGLRHHYWALDWRDPSSSFRKMVNAGFRYDCSIAWSDSYGLRSGTCLPHRPFDKRYNRPLNIYLLPTCMLDFRVEGLAEADQSAISRMMREIKSVNGMLNLDWHTEAICNTYPFAGFVDTLRSLLSESGLSPKDSLLPGALVQTWHQRVNPLANMYPHLKLP